MARMMTETHPGFHGCGRRNKCCRSRKWITHHGRNVGRIRKTVRVQEKQKLRKEEW